jgi:hypothetical protein
MASLRKILDKEYVQLKQLQGNVSVNLFYLLPPDLERMYEKKQWVAFLLSVQELYSSVMDIHRRIDKKE